MKQRASSARRAIAASLVVMALNAYSAPTDNQAVPAEPLILSLHYEAPSLCRVQVEGRTFSLPADEQALLEFLRSLRPSWNYASLSGGMEIPYRCVGPVIFLAQRAGFAGIGFTAEPAEPRPSPSNAE